MKLPQRKTTTIKQFEQYAMKSYLHDPQNGVERNIKMVDLLLVMVNGTPYYRVYS